jgi:hypothetical protein
MRPIHGCERRRQTLSAKQLVSPALALVVMLVSASVAIHYRNKATHMERELAAVLARADDSRVGGEETRQPTEPPVLGAGIPSRHGDGPTEGISPTGLVSRLDGDARPGTQSDEVLPSDDEPVYVITPKMREEAARRRELEGLLRFEAQQPVLDAMTRATNYFANRKTSGMTVEQLAEFDRMVALLGKTVELKQALILGTGMGERARISSAIQSNLVSLAPMLENERNQQYRDLAVAMGHSKADASLLAGYISQIVSNTSINAIFPETSARGDRVRARGMGGPGVAGPRTFLDR